VARPDGHRSRRLVQLRTTGAGRAPRASIPSGRRSPSVIASPRPRTAASHGWSRRSNRSGSSDFARRLISAGTLSTRKRPAGRAPTPTRSGDSCWARSPEAAPGSSSAATGRCGRRGCNRS
jgi:hypothetical protein